MISGLVFHYTSMDSLYKIIRNRTLLLTDFRSSMDKIEVTYAEKVLKKYITEFKFKDVPYAKKYFTLSCTESSDSYLHFNSYGEHCSGVAIGINRNFIDDLVYEDGHNGNSYHNGVDICDYELKLKTIYEEKQKQKDKDKVRDKLSKLYNDAVADKNLKFMNLVLNHYGYSVSKYLYFDNVIYNKEIIESEIKKIRVQRNLTKNDVTFIIQKYLSRIKSESFQEEKEVRLALREDFVEISQPYPPVKDFLNDAIQTYNKTHFLCCKDSIRDTRLLDLNKFGINNVIKSITLGPASRQEISTLKNFLAENRVEAEILKSSIRTR